MITGLLELFLGGIFVGSTSCLLICAPIVLPYLLGTSENWKKALAAVLIFSAARITVYTFYGFIIGLGKQIYIDKFIESDFSFYLQIFAGLVILVIGFLLVLGKSRANLCPGLDKLLIKHNLRTVFFLGLFMGMMPCPPLMAAFAYVFIKANNLASSVFLVWAFGLGTAVSPLLLLGTFSGFVTQKTSRTKFLRVLRVLAGSILLFWGFQIIASRMGLVVRL